MNTTTTTTNNNNAYVMITEVENPQTMLPQQNHL